MRWRQLIPALLFAAGAVVSTVSDVDSLPPPVQVDGYYILAADFHVHAAFGDGGLAPWDARREAERRGLDVIAITNHNQLVGARLHRALFDDEDLPLVFVGEEVTAPFHHIVAVGISGAVDWRGSAAETIDAIHAAGGIAIAAHPGKDSAVDFDDQAFARLDAAERAHPGMHLNRDGSQEFAEFFARAQRHNPRVAPVGNSDFHVTGRIGLCRTYVLAREVTKAAVLDAIRGGRTVAYDDWGKAYGDSKLVEIVERARSARGRADTSPWATRASAAGALMVWLGLAGLVALGPATERSGDRRA